MKTLETDAEIHADGSVTLLSPIPSWLKPGRTRVLLVVDSAADNPSGKIVIPQPGSLKGFWMAPDFDEPLIDFKEYME